jgi:two-component system cell cycle response regulator DivK
MSSLERILVVSDEPAERDEFKFGFPVETEVAFAADAREAWERMRDWTPSAVVVDLQTGSAGGFGLARDMADDPRLARVPVILLLERPQDAWLAKEAGASAYLVKPVTANRVLRALASTTALG